MPSFSLHEIQLPDYEHSFPDTELRFYSRYEWCLNLFPRVGEVIEHLRNEVDYLNVCCEKWQIDEIRINIFLLACSISDAADDYLNRKRRDFSRLKKKARVLTPLFAVLEFALELKQRTAEKHLAPLRAWRQSWENAVHSLLLKYAHNGPIDATGYNSSAQHLVNVLDCTLPNELSNRRIKSPRAFHSQDLTFSDILKLAHRFCIELDDYKKPYLIVGLRTAGSYFAPVLRAYMVNRGYLNTGIVTLRPKAGLSKFEIQQLRNYSKQGGIAVVVDEPVYQGTTLAICIQLLRNVGFIASSTVAIFPLHPAARDWQATNAAVALNGCKVITISPEETHRYETLQTNNVGETIREYLELKGYRLISIYEDDKVRKISDFLTQASDEGFHTRHKRVYAVKLEKPNGQEEVHYIIAKSVGCGWQCYQTFYVAKRLSKFISPVIGLRDGVLYCEWVGSGPPILDDQSRTQLSTVMSSYIAQRVNNLRYSIDPSPSLGNAGLQFGMDILVHTLSGAYKSNLVRRIKTMEISSKLAKLHSSHACLLDAKMRSSKWIRFGDTYLKSDFAQHGMGRMDLSVTDPAYDIADAVLSLSLSHAKEDEFVKRYIQQSNDHDVRSRLPLYKLLAGQWSMGGALYCLNERKLADRHIDASSLYITAWTFSMIQMARFCGGFIPKHPSRSELRPLVFLDVDGVIDQHIFDFPTSTQSGIRALSLLIANGFPVYLNTARSAYDVKEYCAAYGLPGGVAETGSYIWDAVSGREQILVGPESLAELDLVRMALQKLPGVFINGYYQYSIKAFSYSQTGTIPLPSVLLHKIFLDLQVKTLVIHQTSCDTTIVCNTVNKGTGLVAFTRFIEKESVETIAVGDTAPDLEMFRVANRSYAPSHTPVRGLATLLGCRVVSRPYQLGLLDIVHDIVRSENAPQFQDVTEPTFVTEEHNQLLIDLLGDIETSSKVRLISALVNPRTLFRLMNND